MSAPVPLKHATIYAIWLVWTGWTPGATVGVHNIPMARATCGAKGPALIGSIRVFREIPTCPRCAVLYDEAMTAREELLGRKEAA